MGNQCTYALVQTFLPPSRDVCTHSKKTEFIPADMDAQPIPHEYQCMCVIVSIMKRILIYMEKLELVDKKPSMPII